MRHTSQNNAKTTPPKKRGASYLNPKHFVKVPGLLPGTVKSQLRHSFSSKIKTWGSPLRWFGPPALEKVSWLAIKTASLRQVGVLPTQQGAEIPDLFRIWGLIILWIARMFVIRVWKAHRHVVVVDHKLRPHGSIFGDSGFTETDRCPNPRGLSFVSSWISSHQVPMTMMVNSNDIQASKSMSRTWVQTIPSDTRPTPSDTNPPWGSEIHGWREKDIETPLDSMGTYNIYIYAYIQKWLSINCILFERSIFLCYVTLPECYLRNSQALFVPSDYSKTPPQKPKGRTPACRRFAVRLGAYDIIGSQEKTRDEIMKSSKFHVTHLK